MGPTPGLIDEIYREKVLRARRTPIEEKVLSGAELFEQVALRMKAGLSSENPGADDATIEALLVKRIARLRQVRAADVRR
jgi:hypothetical protein